MCSVPNLVVMVMLLLVGGGGSTIIFTEGATRVSRQVVLEVFSAFKEGISSDPSAALDSWDTSNQSSNPCSGDWAGLQCDYGDNTSIITITNIDIDLKNKSLQGSITPQLSRLSGALFSLDLSYNSLSGTLTFLSNFSSSDHDNPLQSLILDYNNLTGPFTLPPSCFPRLVFLSIAMNSFSGRLPSESLSQCPSLQLFNVSNNNFSGPLFPAGLGNLTTTLKALDAGINDLSGPIPPSIGNCSKLTFLSLPWNNFSGHIPSLGCPNLAFLSLFQNTLSGTLPSEMGLLSKLDYLSVGFNRGLSGDFFKTLANCSALSTVDTTNTSFTGQMQVDFGSRFPYIQSLNMEFNMLTGSIPESLGNCSGLTFLTLGFNYHISGTIPAALFRARNIIQLDLQFNSLRGPIPTSIGNLTSVQRAFLNNNQFTGSLPEELGMLASIHTLTLEHNSLSGNFPNQLFNCTTLTGLGLHDNSLGGPISSSIGRLINLGSMDASNNKLTGQIPLELSHCTILEAISLSNNKLSGEIPRAVIKNLPKCSMFDFSRNNLSGPIPDAEFGGKIYLVNLNLSHNQLSGAVPSGLAGCVALASLDLSQNMLAGSIPSSLGKSLVVLDLSYNFINGSIPTEWSDLNQSLQHLDLSSNALSGTIPSALAQMKSLQFLNLSYNSQLEGIIPTGGVFTNLTFTSFLGDSMLCGAAINTTCSTRRRHISSKVIMIISVAVAASLLVILGFLAFILLHKRRRRGSNNWDFSPYLRLRLEDIQEATRNFSEDYVLGAGATGTVYKGILKDGTWLAFKKFKLDDGSMRSFIRELESVGLIRHRNLVRIMGYYSNLDTSILILEYMPNGDLEDHLHGGRNHEEAAVLSWDTRLRVAIGVAHGLLYLHNDCPSPVIHCDLKPQNILFDADMEVRISDFGLAKVMASAATSSFTNNMQGTLGYMAPELASYGHITRKCDVYSYGILLVELITGRRPSEDVQMSMQHLERGEECVQGTKTLVQWVASMLEANDINNILDMSLQEAIRYDTNIRRDEIDDQMKKILNLALQCTQENPRRRPTMKQVMQTLLSITSTHDHVQVNSKVLEEIMRSNSKSMAKSGQDSI